jgi:hypothetical protein
VEGMASDPQHCSFVLLAEFDILRGAQLTYQFPQPLGTDEWCVRNFSNWLDAITNGLE